MDESQAVAAFGALAQETRLRILRFLVTMGADGAPAGTVGRAVGASTSRLSFHLAALEAAGLVRSERVSRNIVYRADFARIGALLAFLLEECCARHPEVAACCGLGTRSPATEAAGALDRSA